MAERWRRVHGWPAYQVSDLGRVKSLARKLKDGRRAGGVILKPEIGRGGYEQVTLSRGGPRSKRRHRYVHQLVAEAFLGPRPAGMEVRHLNGNPLDNCLVNLCYGTPAENKQDQELHGTSGRALTAELARGIRDRYAADPRETYDTLGAAYGVSRTTIQHVLTGRSWDHIGGARSNGQRAAPWVKSWAKLTDDKVREIRARHADGETARSLASAFDVTPACIGQVTRRETWRHVRDNEEKKEGKRKRVSPPLDVGTDLGQ